MSLAGKLAGQMPQRLRRPSQRRFRIPALVRLDHCQQRSRHGGVVVLDRLTPAARGADPPFGQRRLAGLELGDPATHGGLAHPRCPGRDPHPTVAEQPSFGGHRQPPLSLVQMRQQHREPVAQLRRGGLADRHTTSTTAKI
jgi:hypothetical protein